MSDGKSIDKKAYTWKAETVAVNEAAVKYDVTLAVASRRKPDLKLVGFKSSNVMEQIAELKKGLPAGMVDALARELEVSRKELARIAGVAERTLIRKVQDGRLTTDQSERMARIARLLIRAIEVLDGNEQALRWLKAPRPQLGGKAPLDFADTELGCQEVVNLLGRIEHGVFS